MALAKIFYKKERITQLFGKNPKMYARFDMKGHNWIDFGVPIWTPILASLEGKVETWSTKDGYGRYIKIFKIRSDWISEIIYGHLSKSIVTNGQLVKVGELIGYSGNTGNSTWPHLHFGLRFRDLNMNVIWSDNWYKWWLNPLPFFSTDGK